MTKRGIIAGGNWIVDRVKIIDSWPQEETLVTIVDQLTGSGGAAFNVLLDLAKLGANMPLEGIGMIGTDSDAEYVLRECRDNGIAARLIKKTPNAPTSYTDVMTVRDTGKRTYFHNRGANSHLEVSHFDFYASRSKIFHLGYLLLLDKLDETDTHYGTGAAKVLSKAQDVGLKTSVDVVSEQSDRFRSVVIPALRHVNYCFMNEVEAEKTTGIVLREGSELLRDRMFAATRCLLDAGVSDWVFIHAREGVVAMNAAGAQHWQGAVRVPQEVIKGTAGAGDAFAAGVLLGLHDEQPITECLKNGVCAAAACLTHPTTTGGILPLSACLQLGDRLGYRV